MQPYVELDAIWGSFFCGKFTKIQNPMSKFGQNMDFTKNIYQKYLYLFIEKKAKIFK